MKKIDNNQSLSWMEKERARTKAHVRFYHSIGRHQLASLAQGFGGMRLGIMSVVVPVVTNPFKSRAEINQAGLKLAREAKSKRMGLVMTIVTNKIEAEQKAIKTRDTQDWIEFVTEKAALIATGIEGGLALEVKTGQSITQNVVTQMNQYGDLIQLTLTKGDEVIEVYGRLIDDGTNLQIKVDFLPQTVLQGVETINDAHNRLKNTMGDLNKEVFKVFQKEASLKDIKLFNFMVTGSLALEKEMYKVQKNIQQEINLKII
jgi:hypothetical protein